MQPHTPAPWRIVKATENHGVYIEDSVGRTICNFYFMTTRPLFAHHANHKANAVLVAAAPDLLEALLVALPYVEGALDDVLYKPGAVRRDVKVIRAAIAKAGPKPTTPPPR